MIKPFKVLHRNPKAVLLVLMGLIFIAVGAANWTTADQITTTVGGRNSYWAQINIIPDFKYWGLFFAIAGIGAVWAACVKKPWLGFLITMFMSIWWTLMSVVSLFVTGYERIWSNILLWGLISIFIYTLSAWPEFPYKDSEL